MIIKDTWYVSIFLNLPRLMLGPILVNGLCALESNVYSDALDGMFYMCLYVHYKIWLSLIFSY